MALISSMSLAAQSVSIDFHDGAFEVSGWKIPASAPAGGWQSVFAVYAGTGDVPAMAGSYAVESGKLAFHPSYPLAPGVHYRAVFLASGSKTAVEKRVDGPQRATVAQARVEHVYPSGDTLPSNQLRLYIYFSAPMSRGEAARRIHILNENGKPLPYIFVPGEELWDPEFRRLTLTFDPGRIKRGVGENVSMGPPIAPGHHYTLLIERGWQDARGLPMVQEFRKRFVGGPAIRTTPDPARWRITPPVQGTAAPVTVDFPRPMNFVLLGRMLRVSGPGGTVPGTVSVERRESRWRFVPSAIWKAGKYQIVVDTALEDQAGNKVNQAFDVDVFEKVTEHISSNTITLPFEVK
jgi:hypothetical protein